MRPAAPRSMKPVRIGYGLNMAAFLFAGLLTGERLCFLLFFIQLLLALFCIGLLLFTFSTFTFVQSLSRPQAEKGESVGLHIEIHNEKPYPFTRMKLHIRALSRADDQVLSFCLAPLDHIFFDLPIPCRWRGEAAVGMQAVELEDMFGLIHIRLPLSLLSYYRMRPLIILPHADTLTLSTGGQAGRQQESGSLSHRSDAGRDPYGLRAYQPGDTERQIHWKASAAHRTLYTRQFEREARPQCLILLDDRPQGTGEAGSIAADLLCSAAATLCRWALSHESSVRLCAGSLGIPAAEGDSLEHFPSLQRWLALLPFEGGGEAPQRLMQELAQGRADRRMVYLICGDALPLLSALSEARQRGAQVTCIRVAGEAGDPLPALPDGIPDILLEPGCDIGARLGEGL